MPITNDSLNKDLYRLLKVRGFDPVPKDSEGETTPVPDEADVFKFTFKRHDKPYGTAWVTVDSNQQLVVYYKDEINNVGELDEDESPAGYDDSWTGFLKNLKNWAQRRQLGFDLENQDHLASDMAQRTHMKKKEQIAEGYYPMGNKASYSDAIPTIKIVLQHTRQIQEGEQRYRNVARIFLENTHGERILAPTTKPGIAQIYARHLAESGVPNDERWNHIKSLCEEYSKMAGFVRAVRGNQFNESAQRLVEAGLNHYQNLRESLGKMRGHRGYNAYFESWTPTLMETEGDESNLNELFVQETLDPRIESVMPILSKLKLNLGEMKEVNELAEWADNVTEDEGRQALNPVGIPESEEGVAEEVEDVSEGPGHPAPGQATPSAAERKKSRDYQFTAAAKKARNAQDKKGVAAGSLNEGQYEMMMRNGQVKKFIAKDDADAKRIAAGHGAKSVIRLRGGVPAGKIAEQGVAEGSEETPAPTVNTCKKCGKKWKWEHYCKGTPSTPDKKKGVAEGNEQIDEVSMEKMLKYVPNAVADLSDREIRINTGKGTEKDAKKVQDRKKGLSRAAGKIGYKMAPESVAEGAGFGPFDPDETLKAAMPLMNKLREFTSGQVDYDYNKDGSIHIVVNRRNDNPRVGWAPKKGDAFAADWRENFNNAYTPFFNAFRQKGWYFSQPRDNAMDVGVPAQQGVAEGEIEDAEKAHNKINIPAAFRKAKGGDWKVSGQDLEKEKARTGTSPEGLAAIKKLSGIEDRMTRDPIPGLGEDKGKIVVVNPEAQQEMLDWLESEGFDAPEPTTDENGNLVYDFKGMDHNAYTYASDYDIGSEEADDDLAEHGGAEIDLKPNHFYLKSGYGKGLLRIDGETVEFDNFDDAQDLYYSFGGHEMDEYGIYVYDNGKLQYVDSSGEIAVEGLDANQKRAGQLGPTGRPAEDGDLVGTNESVDPLKDMLRLLGR